MDDFADIELKDALVSGQVSEIASWLEVRAPHDIAEEFTRLDAVQSALVWRLLGRDRALEVFEELDSTEQQELLSGMRDQAFREILESMDPDDRARMLGEAPAIFVHRVLQGLSAKERAMTASLLGYPRRVGGPGDEPRGSHGSRSHPRERHLAGSASKRTGRRND